ncbi:MAG: phage head morphogenesis protein [Parcubacteria group bacterium]|jgi:SPP1 gp7 family putative phage head morphogenesis protein|nr:phage head morphogenesis protein [Parcubacteria group bacterium]|tara:strand:- start:13258 stop:14361 length:1104 start_codon:yes stop_codon:yes gene_type:complete
MPKKLSLEDTIIRHQVLLEQVKTHEARQFSSILRKTERAVRDILIDLDEPDISKLNRKKLNALLSKVKRAQQKLLLDNETEFFDSLEGIADNEHKFETKAIKANVKKAMRNRVGDSTTKAAMGLALRDPLSATGELLQPFVRDWSRKQITSVNNAIRQAWVNGNTTQQVITAIRGTKANSFNDGLVATSKRQAEAVARTAIQHVSSKARESTWEANKDIIEKYKYRAVLDHRTTTQCAGLDGQEFPVGQGPMPPIHIQCRSTTIPVISKEFEFLSRGATRASADGPVSARTTYYGWLKRQDKGFQEDVIGKERTKLLRSNKLSATEFAKLQLNKNFEPRTLAEMQKKEAALFEELGVNVRNQNVNNN